MRTVRHSARSRYQLRCRFQTCSWSRMMTSSRWRTATCADTGTEATSTAATPAPNMADFILTSFVSPETQRNAGRGKMFPFELNLRRRARCRLATQDQQVEASASVGEAPPETDLSGAVEQAACPGRNRSPSQSEPEDQQSHRYLRLQQRCRNGEQDQLPSDISQHWRRRRRSFSKTQRR